LSRKSKASPGQQKLGRAQSNITTRIQQLEEELDVELFVRGNKNGLSCAESSSSITR
jgi:DNA-binding transcriptional LysR family regulator